MQSAITLTPSSSPSTHCTTARTTQQQNTTTSPTYWPATTHQHTIYTNHRPRSPALLSLTRG